MLLILMIYFWDCHSFKTLRRCSIEFPHLLRLLENNQFDTIYHEHYSYLSLKVVQRIAASCSLQVVDVDLLDTHGGSLRVWLSHSGATTPSNSVQQVIDAEDAAGLESLYSYNNFQYQAESAKFNLLQHLLTAKQNNNLILGYGAAAKGNTFLNYAGISSDLLPAVVDRAPSKQGKFLPGSHIEVISPDCIASFQPDELLLLPWNLISEIREQLPQYRLVTAIPTLVTHNRLS